IAVSDRRPPNADTEGKHCSLHKALEGPMKRRWARELRQFYHGRQYTKRRGCRAICSTRVRRTKGYSRLQQSGEPLELTTSKPGTNSPAISLDFSEPLMKYIDHQPCGAAEVLKLAEMPVPEPGAGEVLIEVRA